MLAVYGFRPTFRLTKRHKRSKNIPSRALAHMKGALRPGREETRSSSMARRIAAVTAAYSSSSSVKSIVGMA